MIPFSEEPFEGDRRMIEEQIEDENSVAMCYRSVGMCYQAERTCANCREWYINTLGERECLQTSCEDYSDWVERPKSSEVKNDRRTNRR